jgi:hypothetical protein
VITTINTDLAPCYFAASEAVAYQEVAVRGTTTAAQRAQAPRLLNDDLIACSLVNSSVFDLANIDVPGSATAKQLASMLDDSTTWAVRDAHDTIAEIQILEAHPNSPGALAALRVDLGLMATDRASAAASRASAASLLDAKLPALLLPAVGSASAVLGAP